MDDEDDFEDFEMMYWRSLDSFSDIGDVDLFRYMKKNQSYLINMFKYLLEANSLKYIKKNRKKNIN